MSPPRYPSDLSDREWVILEPLLSSAQRRGRPPKWPLRHVADAADFYLLLRSGCSWRMLPREYPPWQTVYYHLPASGGSTAGCAGPTTGCERWCARWRVATATPARPSSTARWSRRPPRWAGRNAATTERSASPGASATSWSTRAGWCWPRGSVWHCD